MTANRRVAGLGAVIAGSALVASAALADPAADCQQTADPDLAIDGCTNVLASASGDQMVLATYARAIAYFGKHDYYHAIKDFSVVISNRQVYLAYADRGLAYLNLMADDPTFADLALSDLNQALALKPDLDPSLKVGFSYAYATRAATELANGQDAQAAADNDAAIQLNPDKGAAFKANFAQAYNKRAWSGLAGADYEHAVDDLQQAIQLDPTTSDKLTPYLQEAQAGQPGPYTAIARGSKHEADGAEELAANDYTEAINGNPNLAEAHLRRGYAYEALDRLDEARADFDQAIKLDPNNWTGYFARGNYYQSTDQFDQARDDFNHAATVVDQTHDAGFDYEKKTIDDALRSVQFDSALSDRWVSYLKEIQLANNYPNWSAAPYDLYAQSHNLPTLPPPPASPPPAAAPAPPKKGLSGFQWAMLGLGVAASLGMGAGAHVLYRRRRGL